MTILSSLVAPEVVVTTTSGATSNDKNWHYDNSQFSVYNRTNYHIVYGFHSIVCNTLLLLHVPTLPHNPIIAYNCQGFPFNVDKLMVYDKIASTPFYRIIFTKINVYIVKEINPDMQTQFGHCTNRVYRLIVLLSGLQYAHLPNVTI